MISKLSEKFANRLFSDQNVTNEERELYVYGFYMILSHLIYLVLAFIFGLIFECVLESIIFYVAFQFIRRSAGGYHASTETRCQIISTLSIFVTVAFISVLRNFDLQTLFLIITIFSAVLIWGLCPLDTMEKPLSKNETVYFRKKSRIILTIIFLIIVISYFLKFYFLFAPCCMSLILESILLISGQIKKSIISP